MTPIESYNRKLEYSDFVRDAAQEKSIRLLQRIYDELTGSDLPAPGLIARLLGTRQKPKAVEGLYLWGGVGRGKTLVVDEFYECLPFKEKKRIHFHRFMHKVHRRLKELRQLQDPLSRIAGQFSDEFRILCFDEFIVNDIADAMILSGLLQHMFADGITLVATSNIHPDELYKNGLQRDRFQPAIDLIKANTTVHEMAGDTDYRLEFLTSAEIYFHPHDDKAFTGLQRNFDHIASEPEEQNVLLEIDGREIRTLQHATGIVWFDFSEICGGPRSQNDYIELARCFNTVVVSDIPALSAESDDQARRFINLIDILYDRNVKFMGSGCCPPQALYQGNRLANEFRRVVSRLAEMQSIAYMAREHLT
jgi:cell division protein ZapE